MAFPNSDAQHISLIGELSAYVLLKNVIKKKILKYSAGERIECDKEISPIHSGSCLGGAYLLIDTHLGLAESFWFCTTSFLSLAFSFILFLNKSI